MLSKTIELLETRLSEANQLKAECFAYQNFDSWEYWHYQIEFLKAMVDLYAK